MVEKMQIENDVYVDEILKNWKGIIMLYKRFEEKNQGIINKEGKNHVSMENK